MTRLKICGLTTLADARYVAAAGADYAGFIQYEKSPRYVAPSVAKEIISWLFGSKPVGVFVNTPPDEVNRIADDVGFALVQLHGDETPEVCAAVEKPVIKAFRIAPEHDAEAVRAMIAPYRDVVDFFLFDTYHPQHFGGTGRPFNWQAVAGLDVPFFLAGGLSAENVGEAIRATQPYAVDVSSSVESAPGVKDFDKLGAFFDVFRDSTRRNAD